ncbi:hypothetical protein PR048_007819 [Dryococelus australis]|uniref:Uncharacterized protein n=1 Tax=Dryococelus australis TaxID=614101 RepID=A0ABQ9HVC2_9NEOP|nr:hypothetical protein PR048_007819 [Dryococelus australis]
MGSEQSNRSATVAPSQVGKATKFNKQQKRIVVNQKGLKQILDIFTGGENPSVYPRHVRQVTRFPQPPGGFAIGNIQRGYLGAPGGWPCTIDAGLLKRWHRRGTTWCLAAVTLLLRAGEHSSGINKAWREGLLANYCCAAGDKMPVSAGFWFALSQQPFIPRRQNQRTGTSYSPDNTAQKFLPTLKIAGSRCSPTHHGWPMCVFNSMSYSHLWEFRSLITVLGRPSSTMSTFAFTPTFSKLDSSWRSLVTCQMLDFRKPSASRTQLFREFLHIPRSVTAAWVFSWCSLRGGVGVVLRLLGYRLGETGSISGVVAPAFLYVRIMSDDGAGRRNFLGISRFPRSCIPSLLHSHLSSPSSALKTSMLRAAQLFQLSKHSYTPTIYLLHKKLINAAHRAAGKLAEQVTVASDVAGGPQFPRRYKSSPPPGWREEGLCRGSSGIVPGNTSRGYPRSHGLEDEVERSLWLRATCLRVPTLNSSPANTYDEHGLGFGFLENSFVNHATRLAPRRTGLDSRQGRYRMFACRNCAGRCRWSAGFSRGSPVSPHHDLIGSQGCDVKIHPNLFTHSLTHFIDARGTQQTGSVDFNTKANGTGAPYKSRLYIRHHKLEVRASALLSVDNWNNVCQGGSARGWHRKYTPCTCIIDSRRLMITNTAHTVLP